jgi:prepilin-type N-terminal cleavage/methylation domain-containing protein
LFSNKKGYTLVEILVVVVIIGVMASLIMPRLTGQTEKARVAEAVNILSAMRRGQEAYFNENSDYLPLSLRSPASEWAKIGMAPPTNSPFWQFFTTRLSGAGQVLWAVRALRIGTPPAGCQANGQIQFTLSSTSGIGTDPWSNSTSCYATGQPYHPAR